MSATPPPPFLLGVNYWPRRKAMYWWSAFDAAEVREEFALIADLGLDFVRIFLLWDDWQPAPDRVAAQPLADLETVCNIAGDLGLKLDITFFTGHMSGPNWAPAWLLADTPPPSPHVRQVISGGAPVARSYLNMFTDETALAAAELLLHTVVSRLAGHAAVGLWNLGNEPDLFAWPPSAAAGRQWTRRMAGLIRAIDESTPITCGLHVHSLIEDNGLRLPDVFGAVDWAVMHGYPMYAAWARGPLDPDFAPYLCALTAALSGKPALMEEFGGCTAPPGQASTMWEWTSYGHTRRQFMASEQALADYLALVLPKLVEAGATGAMLWCFADYTPALWQRPPCLESRHERHFGLVRPDGTLKPHAHTLAQFASTRPTLQPARRTVTLDISPDEFYEAPAHHAARLYANF